MHFNPNFLMLTALALGVCGAGLWKGETPERWAAGLILPGVLLSIIGSFLPDLDFSMLELVGDGVTALGFLVLLMIYGRLWLGAAMLLQAAQFALHSYYLVTERKNDLFHAIVNNVNFFGILISLAIGTALTVLRRRRPAYPQVLDSAA